MKNNQKKKRRGGVLALVAIFLPVAFILAGFAINVAYMELSRTELRVSTDAAARAGGRTLALTGDPDEARRVARLYAGNNPVAGDPLQLADSDLVFGQSTRDSLDERYEFKAGRRPYNALNVVGRRNGSSLSGAVQLFMPGIMSVDQFEPVQSGTATQIELDLAIVIDRSGSMAFGANESAKSGSPALAPEGWSYCDAVPPGSRWLDAVAGAKAFLRALTETPQTERVALVTYGTDATIDVPLSDEYSYSDFDGSVVGLVPTAMDAHTASFCGGRTNIGGAILLAEDALYDSATARPWAVKTIVVMTDGRHNTGTNPVNAAKRVGKKGTTIFTITFSAEAKQADMEKVAELGAGLHIHADNGSELVDAYEEIVKSLPTLLTD